jgi:hypothetical protein
MKSYAVLQALEVPTPMSLKLLKEEIKKSMKKSLAWHDGTHLLSQPLFFVVVVLGIEPRSSCM